MCLFLSRKNLLSPLSERKLDEKFENEEIKKANREHEFMLTIQICRELLHENQFVTGLVHQ